MERYEEETVLVNVYKGKIPDVQLKQSKYPALGNLLAVIYNSNSGSQRSLFKSDGTGTILLIKLKYLAFYVKTEQVTKCVCMKDGEKTGKN